MEKRRFNRIAIQGDAVLCQGQSRWPAQIADLSLQGALLSLSTEFDGDTEQSFLLDIHLPQLDAAIVLEGNVTRSAQSTIGFHTELMDIESATQLRRVIELNSASEDALHNELNALINHHSKLA